MLLFEAEGKQLLREAGFTVPRGRTAHDAPGAVAAAGEIGGMPCMLKAQTLAGGRGKRGLVVVVDSEAELRRAADAMARAEPIAGFLVEEQIGDVAAAVYLAVTIAEADGRAVLLLSPRGGVDVESESAADRASLVRLPIVTGRPPWPFEILEALLASGVDGRIAAPVARAAARLVRLAMERACVLAEINPLLVTATGDAIAVDAKIELDDDDAGTPRPPLIFSRPRDPLAVDAAAQGISFARFGDGEIGIVVGGAGLAMLTVDALRDAGLRPANFMDLQGSSTEKMAAAFALLARIDGLAAILTNNAGGLNTCVALAQGIVLGARALPADLADLPIVVKLHGADATDAWALLASTAPRVRIAPGTTREAVETLRAVLR